MAVTVKDIAEALGLNHSTVAYTIAGKGTIADKTRQRVLRKAAELGYVPNRLAGSLRKQKTRTIGLVVPDVVMVFSEFVQHVFREAAQRNYRVEIALTEHNPKLENQAVQSMLESQVDGIIVKTCYLNWNDVPENNALRQMVARRMPAVLWSSSLSGSSLPQYKQPANAIGQLLAEHLLSLGHRRFAWLFPFHTNLGPIHVERVEGFASALRAAGCAESPVPIVTLAETGPDRAEEQYLNYIDQGLPRSAVQRGRNLFRKAMALSPRPTAVMCYNDVMAIGAIAEAQAMGLRVPQDVAVAATWRTVAAELSPISLTTVDVPVTAVASTTFQLLLETIQNHDEDNELPAPVVTADPVLIEGRSTTEA